MGSPLDCAILGFSITGISAAIHCQRAGLSWIGFDPHPGVWRYGWNKGAASVLMGTPEVIDVVQDQGAELSISRYLDRVPSAEHYLTRAEFADYLLWCRATLGPSAVQEGKPHVGLNQDNNWELAIDGGPSIVARTLIVATGFQPRCPEGNWRQPPRLDPWLEARLPTDVGDELGCDSDGVERVAWADEVRRHETSALHQWIAYDLVEQHECVLLAGDGPRAAEVAVHGLERPDTKLRRLTWISPSCDGTVDVNSWARRIDLSKDDRQRLLAALARDGRPEVELVAGRLTAAKIVGHAVKGELDTGGRLSADALVFAIGLVERVDVLRSLGNTEWEHLLAAHPQGQPPSDADRFVPHRVDRTSSFVDWPGHPLLYLASRRSAGNDRYRYLESLAARMSALATDVANRLS